METSTTVEEIIRRYPFLRSNVADFSTENGVGRPILPEREVGRLKFFTESFPTGLLSSRIKAKKGRLYTVQEVGGHHIVTILPLASFFQVKSFPGMTNLVHKYWDYDNELVIKIIGLNTREEEETLPVTDEVSA